MKHERSAVPAALRSAAGSAVELEAAGDALIAAVVLDGGGALSADRGVELGERDRPADLRR